MAETCHQTLPTLCRLEAGSTHLVAESSEWRRWGKRLISRPSPRHERKANAPGL